jgi:hypothetical protein
MTGITTGDWTIRSRFASDHGLLAQTKEKTKTAYMSYLKRVAKDIAMLRPDEDGMIDEQGLPTMKAFTYTDEDFKHEEKILIIEILTARSTIIE